MKKCANCSFFRVSEDVDCLYHYCDAEPENCCDNFEDKTGERHDLATYVAEQVCGSCDFHGAYREIMDTFTSQEWATFENITFECSVCGWWCETGDSNELNGEAMCSDCYQDQFTYCDCGERIEDWESQCWECQQAEEDEEEFAECSNCGAEIYAGDELCEECEMEEEE